MIILALLAVDGHSEVSASKISDLTQLIDRFEPKNHALYYEMSLAFARLVRKIGDCYHNIVIHKLLTTCMCVFISMLSLEATAVFFERQQL